MNNIEYAAIAIPTLNRLEHLKRCIETLKKSEYAFNTDIFIALDAAPSEEYVTGRSQVENYLDNGIEGFAHVYIMKHEYNLGPIKNMDYVLKWVSQTHDRFVFTEDDNEFSPNYLEYINILLNRYAEDENVIAISGYNYPIKTDITSNEIYNSNTYFAAFGFAGWFKKYYNMQNEMNKEWLYGIYQDSFRMKKLRIAAPNQYCNFVKGMLGYTKPLDNGKEVWKMDLTYGIYMFSNNKKMIFPIVSKVRNWGYDGSGVNCDIMDYDPAESITHRNFSFTSQKLDTRLKCGSLDAVPENENKHIVDRVNEYFFVSRSEVLRCRLAYVISRVLGIYVVRKILMIL